jgi:hypothetical protein
MKRNIRKLLSKPALFYQRGRSKRGILYRKIPHLTGMIHLASLTAKLFRQVKHWIRTLMRKCRVHPETHTGSTIPARLKSNFLVGQNFAGETAALAIGWVTQFHKELIDPVAGALIEVGQDDG